MEQRGRRKLGHSGNWQHWDSLSGRHEPFRDHKSLPHLHHWVKVTTFMHSPQPSFDLKRQSSITKCMGVFRNMTKLNFTNKVNAHHQTYQGRRGGSGGLGGEEREHGQPPKMGFSLPGPLFQRSLLPVSTGNCGKWGKDCSPRVAGALRHRGWMRLELILEGRAWRLKSTVAPSPTLVSTLYYWPSASVRKQMNLLPSFHQKGSSALTLRHGVCAPRLGSPDRRQALQQHLCHRKKVSVQQQVF